MSDRLLGAMAPGPDPVGRGPPALTARATAGVLPLSACSAAARACAAPVTCICAAMASAIGFAAIE